ncbi:MAG: site-2 protease family protein [Deltaproteobacteria bacterium]|nr:site-2 protease family protein [Deltaproteobacteria bacterium]
MFEMYLQKLLLNIPPVLLALTAHECAHAWAAYKLGDPTAKMLGRVSLNPFRHLDPIGTIALFLTGMFGWARPVPINVRNFRNVSQGMMLTAAAGPLANLGLAGASAFIYKLFAVAAGPYLGRYPAVYNPLFIMIELSIVMNVSLAVFNMLPIPPLDGSRVLSYFLPGRKALAFSKIEPYGFVILLLLITTGVINMALSPFVAALTRLLIGGFY